MQESKRSCLSSTLRFRNDTWLTSVPGSSPNIAESSSALWKKSFEVKQQLSSWMQTRKRSFVFVGRLSKQEEDKRQSSITKFDSYLNRTIRNTLLHFNTSLKSLPARRCEGASLMWQCLLYLLLLPSLIMRRARIYIINCQEEKNNSMITSASS